MKIVSKSNVKLAFRLFNPGDEVCLVGYDGGFIDPGKTVDYFVAGFGRFRLEITDTSTGKIIFQPTGGPGTPGFIYDNPRMFEVQPNGNVNIS